MSRKPSWRQRAVDRLNDMCGLHPGPVPLPEINREPVSWWTQQYSNGPCQQSANFANQYLESLVRPSKPARWNDGTG